LEFRTDGKFTEISCSDGNVHVPSPSEGGKTLIITGKIQRASIDYQFKIPGAKTLYMDLKFDMDGDGQLDESTQFIFLRHSEVNPPVTPFVIGLPAGIVGPLEPGMNFRIGRAVQYSSSVHEVEWLTDVKKLEGK